MIISFSVTSNIFISSLLISPGHVIGLNNVVPENLHDAIQLLISRDILSGTLLP